MPFQIVSPHFYLLNHHHQIVPTNGNGGSIFIVKRGKGKYPVFKSLVVDYQTGVFQVQDFHDCAGTIHKNKSLPATNIPFHYRTDQATEGVKTLSHVNPSGVEVILKLVMKMEHGLII